MGVYWHWAVRVVFAGVGSGASARMCRYDADVSCVYSEMSAFVRTRVACTRARTCACKLVVVTSRDTGRR